MISRSLIALILLAPLAATTTYAQGLAAHAQGDYLGKYVVSAKGSSVQSRSYQPEHAFDGNKKSRWSSEFHDDEWVMCSFSDFVRIKQIVITWEIARAENYTLQVTTDGVRWIDLFRQTGASGEVDTITFPVGVKAQGFRLACEKRTTEWGYSIYEIEFYGTSDSKAPDRNLIGWELPPSQWQMRERKIASLLMQTATGDPANANGMSDEELLSLIEKRAFDYFWWETNPTNGLTKDRARSFTSSEEITHASVAACGFAFCAYVVGVQRGWTEYENALQRVKTTLRTFADGSVTNYHGFFPHFVSYFSGELTMGTEYSTIDTALFLSGMIVAMEYFRDPEVEELCTRIFERVNWRQARHGHKHFVSHGYKQDGTMLGTRWGSFTEGLLVYILGAGSPTYSLPKEAWYAVDRSRGNFAGYDFLIENWFQTIYPYHYPDLWFDYRGRTDETGIDYFLNATVASLAMRQYSMDQARTFPKSYGPDEWGLSAADGPDNKYYVYGFPPGTPVSPVDGTFIPYVIAGCLPFIPQHAIRALRYIYDHHHEAWGKYGFTDAVNPTQEFLSQDIIGIDIGTILVAIENHRSGLIWNLFMQNRWIRDATDEIGWKIRPMAADPHGPVDLARGYRWKFLGADGDYASPRYNDRFWQDVVVPEYWEFMDKEQRPRDGVGWYRCEFEIEASRLELWRQLNQPIGLHIGAIDDADRTYINGLVVGETRAAKHSARKARKYIVPLQALRSGKNLLAVRVQDKGGLGGIWNAPVELGPVPSKK